MNGRTPSTAPPINPDQLYSFIRSSSKAYKEHRAFLVALNMGLFDVLAIPKSAEAISQELGVALEMTSLVCELLSYIGLIERQGNEYKNCDISSIFLRRDSPWFQGEVVSNVHQSCALWDKLNEVWKNGPVSFADDEFFAKDNFLKSLAVQALSGELWKTVHIVAARPEFKEARLLLDLGGGHGLYAIAFSRQKPGLQAVVFDFPTLVQVANATIAAYNAKNVHFMAGNFFTDAFGQDYDIVFFSSNPGGKNPHVLERIYDSLKPGGLFVTKHAYYNTGEGSKDRLLDVEWNLVALRGVQKESNIYRFAGDLDYEEVLAFLDKRSSDVTVIEGPAFATPPLAVFGDRLDSKIIMARKKG